MRKGKVSKHASGQFGTLPHSGRPENQRFAERCGNTSPPTAMYDLPGLFRTKVRQKPAKLSPNPTFHLVQTSELPRNLADSPWLSFFKRAKLSKLHETTSN